VAPLTTTKCHHVMTNKHRTPCAEPAFAPVSEDALWTDAQTAL
jgi:hypothetical protein